jgi:hypothetical protein
LIASESHGTQAKKMDAQSEKSNTHCGENWMFIECAEEPWTCLYQMLMPKAKDKTSHRGLHSDKTDITQLPI